MKAFKKYKKYYIPVVTTFSFLGFFGAGLFLGIQSWNKQLYVQVRPSQIRGVASNSQETSLYSVSLEEINKKIQAQLFQNSKTIKKDASFGFYLGQFLIPNEVSGGYQFVCQKYSYVETTFVALDVSINGKQGLMVVQSPCLAKEEGFIGPTWLPVQEMRANEKQRFFESDTEETFIHFYDISFPLVSKWLLKSVKFFNSSEEDYIINYEPGSGISFQIQFD